VSVIDTVTNTVIGNPIPVGMEPYGVVVSPDGTRVYVTNSDNASVSVIDTATNTVIGNPIPVGSQPLALAISPNGDRVYVTNYNSGRTGGSVSVIDTATNTVTKTIPVGQEPFGVVVSPDGTRVYVANQYDGTLSVIDTATNTTVGIPIPVGIHPYGVAVSPDGDRVYVSSGNSRENAYVSVINTVSNVVNATIPVGSAAWGIAISPDGGRVYVTSFDNNTVSVIDTATNTTSGNPIPVGTEPYGVAVSPNGNRLYVTDYAHNTALVIDATGSTGGGTGGGGGTGSAPLTVAKLFADMHPDTTDTIRAQLVLGSDGTTKRMIVYMSGIDPVTIPEGGFSNTGSLNPLVSGFIDAAVNDWHPTEIMLVGFSNGGQQMQNYAATGANSKLVKVVVLLAAPLTKTAVELPNTDSLDIVDVGDQTYSNWSHPDAQNSYLDNPSDNKDLYWAGTFSSTDTHGVKTYVEDAAEFDKYVTGSGASAVDKAIYDDIQGFGGTPIGQPRSAGTSPTKIEISLAQQVIQWGITQVQNIQQWGKTQVQNIQQWGKTQVQNIQQWGNTTVQNIQQWAKTGAQNVQQWRDFFHL
jgi:YVTN family beta-propeller protein